jgi:hypothetical protein
VSGHGTAADLAALAGWLDEQLDSEHADRQHLAEQALVRVRAIAQEAARAADEALPSSATAWRTTLRQALREAIIYRQDVLPGHPETADQVALYATAARDLGIDLGPGGAL